jgi:carboxylesterase
MTNSTPFQGGAPFSHDGGDVGVLLIHGFPGAPGSLLQWAEHLARAGYTVRLPLLPGHGTRWQDANRTTFADWLGTVTASLHELSGRCRAVVVCGQSMGGTLTLRLAELFPDAMAGIVLVNPSVLTLRKDAKYLLPVLRYVLPAYPGIVGDIAKPDVVEPGYKWIPVKAMYTLSRAWPVVRAELPKVTAPMLLMHSTVDHVVEPVNSQIVRDEVSSEQITDIELERSYHVATMDYDAELIFASSVEFIEKVTASQVELH